MGNKMDWQLDATGNVGRDPVLSYTPGGKLFAKTSMAVEVGWGEYKRTEWVNITVWGDKSAQNFKNFVQKGTTIRVQGDVKINAWTSKEGESKASFDLSAWEWKVEKNGKPKGEAEETPYDEEAVEVQE